jgi:ankyrin repeat protein
MDHNLEKLLKKYYKTYLLGKKIYDHDKEQACEYIKKSLNILDYIKKNHSSELETYSNILIESEKESSKLLNDSIEYYLESEINKDAKTINYIKLFKSIEKGSIDEIKKYNINEIDFRKLYKNKTLLHYAINYGDILFLKYCFKLGASIDLLDSEGHTLLEYACLEKDPNMINFLIQYGANMKKHLYFRDGNIKNINFNDSIDISILLKIIMNSKYIDLSENIRINTLKKYFNLNDSIGFNNYTFNDLFIYINIIINTLDNTTTNTYLTILEEELQYNLQNKLECPKNKLDIILINLIPFIDYPFNLSINWVLSLEIKYLIKKNIKKIIDINEIKKNIINNIWDSYIKPAIINEDYLGIIVSQWITKIKV